MAAEVVRVRGLADLNRSLRRTSKDVRVGVNRELRLVAEPIRSDAETLAAGRITNIGSKWPRMRVGVYTDLVYVAPRSRGKRRGPARRPKFAGLLMDRAMEPALERHQHETAERFDAMLGRVTNGFSRG